MRCCSRAASDVALVLCYLFTKYYCVDVSSFSFATTGEERRDAKTWQNDKFEDISSDIVISLLRERCDFAQSPRKTISR